MGKCCSISDNFLKFQLVYPGKQVANQLAGKQNLLVTDERTGVKMYTAQLLRINKAYGLFTLIETGAGTGTRSKWKVQYHVEMLTLVARQKPGPGPIVSCCASPIPSTGSCPILAKCG